MPHLIQIGDWWYYNRRVPADVAHLDKRNIIRHSTKVRVEYDRRGKPCPPNARARKIAIVMEGEQRRFWADLLKGRSTVESYADLKAAMKSARLMGLVYLTREQVVRLPNPELFYRTDIITQPNNRDLPHADPENINDIRATLGGDPEPENTLLLSELLAAYEALPKIRKTLTLDKKGSEELARWRQVRRLAIAKLITSIDDKDIARLTPADGRQFIDDCMDHIEEQDGKGHETARQQFAYLTKMVRLVAKSRELKRPNGEPLILFADDNPFDQAKGKRMPFAIDFVRNRMLAKPNNLDATIHDLVLVCIDTGARPSEIIRTPENDLYPAASIPYIDIRAGNGRAIKNKFSERKIPLVGVALEAMQRNPKGFSQFRQNHEYVRRQINDWLRSLQPDIADEEKKTLYCLRHTFKDRLLRVSGIHQETIDYLMGHNPKKENYGDKGVDFTQPYMSQLAF
jgi:integrase